MALLGYNVRSLPNGETVVEGEDGEEVNSANYVSLKTYCYTWKRDYPSLKVSRPVEDICQYCYAFANQHRYLAIRSNLMADPECGDEDDNFGNDKGSNTNAGISESASSTAAKDNEILLLEAAVHIKMARAQHSLYQAKVEAAIRSARAGNIHSEKTYTFVVDYGQNMEIPVYKEQQPGCTYYFSPLSVYNLGVVNHGHIYDNGKIGEHMYAHVYQEGVGKKGANNVASLIVKTLRLLNLLQDDSVGGELNIIFDNCSGQNKNNTVLRLAAWLTQMGYFKKVKFVFLIVGHTKNAADRLFNSLKHEYRKENIFTMQALFDCLGVSDSVTVVPSVAKDFLDFDEL